MKITKTKLKQLIREELTRVLSEEEVPEVSEEQKSLENIWKLLNGAQEIAKEENPAGEPEIEKALETIADKIRALADKQDLPPVTPTDDEDEI